MTSQLTDTNQVIVAIIDFLFTRNAIFTWFHIFVAVVAVSLATWAGRLKPTDIPSKRPCRHFAQAMMDMARSSFTDFLTAFGVGFVMFCVGVSLNAVNQVPSLTAQVLTYMPTVILAFFQIRTAKRSVDLVKTHMGYR